MCTSHIRRFNVLYQNVELEPVMQYEHDVAPSSVLMETVLEHNENAAF